MLSRFGFENRQEPERNRLQWTNSNNCVEARFAVGLPAKGRSILGKLAEQMFVQEIPKIVGQSLIASNLDSSLVLRHIQTAEDTHAIHRQLPELGFAAFVADRWCNTSQG